MEILNQTWRGKMKILKYKGSIWKWNKHEGPKWKFWNVKSQNANNSKTINIHNARIFVCEETDRPSEGGT